MKIGVDFRCKQQASIIELDSGTWSLHLGVERRFWTWGRAIEDYDLCAVYYGLGPLFLLVVPT